MLILAGGSSSRMGRDKATIEIDGVPLIRRLYDVVARCSNPVGDKGQVKLNRVYVVTPWQQRYQPLLPADCHFIAEQNPHQGPLSGFAQGLAQIQSAWSLLLACDLPNLSTPMIQSWITKLDHVPNDSIAYLPKHINPHPLELNKGWEPLCGFYRRSCLDALTAHINHGGRSFQGWLKTEVVTELTIADPIVLFNCNTPEDLVHVVMNDLQP